MDPIEIAHQMLKHVDEAIDSACVAKKLFKTYPVTNSEAPPIDGLKYTQYTRVFVRSGPKTIPRTLQDDRGIQVPFIIKSLMLTDGSDDRIRRLQGLEIGEEVALAIDALLVDGFPGMGIDPVLSQRATRVSAKTIFEAILEAKARIVQDTNTREEASILLDPTAWAEIHRAARDDLPDGAAGEFIFIGERAHRTRGIKEGTGWAVSTHHNDIDFVVADRRMEDYRFIAIVNPPETDEPRTTIDFVWIGLPRVLKPGAVVQFPTTFPSNDEEE